MHSDELKKLVLNLSNPTMSKILDELITRSDLHTAAIAEVKKQS